MEITRSELYRLVCEKPLSKVAPQFGISGTALAALCKKHVVPYPGSGYWTRVSLGMPVSLQLLPPSEQDAIAISPARPKRIVIKKKDEEGEPEGNGKPDEGQSTPREPPIVKQRLSKPHPIISDWLEKHERRRREVLSSRDSYRSVPSRTACSTSHNKQPPHLLLQFCDDMPDSLTPVQRSAHMGRIHRANTKPELIVRRLLHRLGYRFRLQWKAAPGRPDIAFPGRRKIIFVHGCFWHQHEGCHLAHVPETRRDFWEAKFARNCARDARDLARANEEEWEFLVVWECETRDEPVLEARLKEFVGVTKAGHRRRLDLV